MKAGRVRPVVASGISLPVSMCGSAVDGTEKYDRDPAAEQILHRLRAALVGMCTISTPARALKSSPARCDAEPEPVEA